MPHINRIRVNNVKYNFGTQFYDDFLMRFSCKNTIYDLANGGGKSVLMLLLLQNLIPNCTLDDKQPVEKLFRTGEGSTTIHSLIEWTLSDAHIKDNYKYMLTGFCARKAKDAGEVNEAGEIVKNSSSIEYFNYVIFYRKFNDNDIKNLPLSQNGERITYTGLKNYLKELEKKDLSLEVKIFERKGDYQRFISKYGLYESEWEIIRGINKTEGHVRTYFETNYKTTRKVVEDLLIEEIIEKSFRNNYLDEDSDDKLAQTLLNIKDKLIELSKKKEEINNFDRQILVIDGFSERISNLKQMYIGMEDTFEKIRKIYNTILKSLNNYELEKEKIIEQKENTFLEKQSLSKKVETAKVILEKNKLKSALQEKEFFDKKFEELSVELDALYEKLNIFEGGNYYLEYIEAKKEYDKLLIVMDNILKDNSELISKLKEAVVIKKLADEARKDELSKDLEKEIESLTKEKETIENNSKEVRDLDNNIAIFAHEQKSLTEKIESLNKEINSLKNEVSILLPSQAHSELKLKENELNKCEDKKTELTEMIENISELEIDLKVEAQKCAIELSELTKNKFELESKSKKLLNSSDKLNKLKEVYQESDDSKLCEKIEKAYKNMIVRLDKEKQEITVLKERIECLMENKRAVNSKNVNEVLEYIIRYHTKNAISGEEYISKLEEVSRITAIRNNPILPYSIIVYEKAGQIATDWEMLNITKNCGLIPIISAEEVENFEEAIVNESIVDNEKLICMIGNPDDFKDERIKNDLLKLQEKHKELEKSYERRLENEEVIREDYLFAKLVSENMLDEAQINPKKTIEDLEEKIKELSEKSETIQNKIYENGVEKAKLLKEEEENLKKISELTNEIAIIKELISKLNEYKEIEVKEKRCNDELMNMRKSYSDSSKRLDAIKNVVSNRESRIKLKQDELNQIEKLWKEKYLAYYDESISETILANYTNQSYEVILEKVFASNDIDTVIEGLFEGLLKDNSSVSDKEKLLNNYQISMDRSLQHIEYMGLSKDMFDNMYKNRDLENVSNKDLQALRNEIEELKKDRKSARASLDESRSKCDKIEGSINHSIMIIEKNYGTFEEDLVKSEEINTFLNENERLLNEIESRLNAFNVEVKKLEENEVLLSVLKKDCIRLMEKLQLKVNVNAGEYIVTDVKELDEEYHKSAKELDKFINDKFKRSEEFERELSLLIDTLKKLGATELASEMRMNVVMPKSLSEALELSEGLKETNSYIELEKQRVLKGLQDIQIIKDNFENQCIQSCINIKTELDRLSRLSRITIDDENISVINLKIPYINEELFKDRMSDYIDRIATGVDSYETPSEKLKFIRNNLCWKKMFSVIVTDMNAIKLNLYKRERIASQSRYLPYEEAVGSTGQSQGIYIQFLISIINYISSINSKNTDATNLRKVIFIDNPFGAAKDVYIWEPIFKLLKVNNVQLIVPARGATPAITGRFDVNYVLGQKMCDGRQQTVVVDYFSNVNNEELDYTTLSFEQTALF
ncbi:MAG: hypothetical protein IJA34_12915 [Lachnospiraceae bacterium]|nr:hypothetical protein [Lachnospiraceae bacterium]